MSLWRQLSRGFRVLTQRTAADRDVSDEVDQYLEHATAAHMARGLSNDDARRAARLELGNMTMVREEVRAYGWESWVGTFLTDLRYAARRLRGNKGFSAVAVLTVALGVGATTAIFSAVNPILFQPLPYPHPDRIVMIWDVNQDGVQYEGTFATYAELVAQNRTFDVISVLRPWLPTMTGPAEPERLNGQRVSASYFNVLGVQPAMGRSFGASEDRLNGPNVVILSNALWRRRFGGDRGLIGRNIILNDSSYAVIGIMPPRFENVLASSTDIWKPLQYDMTLPQAWGHHLRTVGRLKPGVSDNAAERDLNVIARTLITKHPQAFGHPSQSVTVLQDDLTRGVKPALVAVFGAVILVLLIACVNVTNLLLASGAQRRGEFAVRAALGAGRARLIGQLLTESLLLAVMGGALGILGATLGVRALVTLAPAGLPRLSAIAIDGSVFAFGLGIATVVGLVVGMIPALTASRSDLRISLQESARRTTSGRNAIRGTLVVAQVALALVLLVGSGLLFRSMARLFAVAPGFDAMGLLTMQVQTNGSRFADPGATQRFFGQALEAVRQAPGVTNAAFTSQLPLSGDRDMYGVHFEQDNTPNDDHSAFRYAVSPGYFETMAIPLRHGRLLDAHDITGAPGAVLINESLASRKFPNSDPVGQHVHVGPTDRPWYTIVGVVGDVKQMSLAAVQADQVYIPVAQWPFADKALSLVVRSRRDAAQLTAAIRTAIWSIDKDQPIVRVAMMDDLLASSAAERRFALILFAAFALMALVLAAAGIYGVLSGGVTERMREIGVRSALGASRGSILALVVRQGMTLTGLGIVIGLVGAIAGSQAVVTLLFGVTRLDPITYLCVIALLLIVSAVACGVPAWRASRVDPVITLRAE